MPTFEEFLQQFDFDKPEETREMLHLYERYIQEVWDRFHKKWTWCGGCHRTVRFDLATAKNETMANGEIKNITRCPECGTPWFVRELEE